MFCCPSETPKSQEYRHSIIAVVTAYTSTSPLFFSAGTDIDTYLDQYRAASVAIQNANCSGKHHCKITCKAIGS